MTLVFYIYITYFDMEELMKNEESKERDIVFSQTIKAGKRIYYIDVKRNRKDELYLAITESNKILNGFGEEATATFEKHKIFLYKEDFEKFQSGITDAIAYIEGAQGKADPRPEPEDSDIKIDVEF